MHRLPQQTPPLLFVRKKRTRGVRGMSCAQTLVAFNSPKPGSGHGQEPITGRAETQSGGLLGDDRDAGLQPVGTRPASERSPCAGTPSLRVI